MSFACGATLAKRTVRSAATATACTTSAHTIGDSFKLIERGADMHAKTTGGFTPFLWMIKCREWFWELLEELTGARLTHSYVRIGGVSVGTQGTHYTVSADTVTIKLTPAAGFTGTNRNVAVTVVDMAGNSTTTSGTDNCMIAIPGGKALVPRSHFYEQLIYGLAGRGYNVLGVTFPPPPDDAGDKPLGFANRVIAIFPIVTDSELLPVITETVPSVPIVIESVSFGMLMGGCSSSPSAVTSCPVEFGRKLPSRV